MKTSQATLSVVQENGRSALVLLVFPHCLFSLLNGARFALNMSGDHHGNGMAAIFCGVFGPGVGVAGVVCGQFFECGDLPSADHDFL
ncbi:hypothetical protein [Photorhabdus sp. SF281]|uniref:hypothetical protein n=1 Tax=Photorhabdus sp. SF281 TaxID=3459527 RepID=UPI004044917E